MLTAFQDHDDSLDAFRSMSHTLFSNRRVPSVRLVFLALVCVCPVYGSDLTADDVLPRFKLFNHCGPMRVVVEDISSDAKGIGLTKYSLTASIESRLRAARLFDADAAPWLYVRVSVVGRACGIDLEFNKRLFDLASGEYRYAPTWSISSTCTHGRNAGYVRSIVADYMDQFLLDYLRVNEEACFEDLGAHMRPRSRDHAARTKKAPRTQGEPLSAGAAVTVSLQRSSMPLAHRNRPLSSRGALAGARPREVSGEIAVRPV